MTYLNTQKDLEIGLNRLVKDAQTNELTDREIRQVLLKILYTELRDERIKPRNCMDLTETIRISENTKHQLEANKRFASKSMGVPLLTDDKFLAMLLDMYVIKSDLEPV